MSRVKVKKDLQISIPKNLAEKFKIKQGDFLSVAEAKEGILFKVNTKGRKMTEDEVRKYWRKRFQEKGEIDLDEETWKKVEESIKASEKGEVVGPFDDIENALKALRSNKP